jgi:hypothetical protein
MDIKDSVIQELLSISERSLQNLKSQLPSEPITRSVILIEALRVIDNWAVSLIGRDSSPVAVQSFDVMNMGWNLALSFLYAPLSVKGFPLKDSTQKTRSEIASLLFGLGRSSLIKRGVDMARTGLMSIEKVDDKFIFKSEDIMGFQFTDEMEFSNFRKLDDKISSANENLYNGWNLLEGESLMQALIRPGNFMSKNEDKYISSFILSDIDSMMLPLIRPWNSGHGIMMAYESTLEIDRHFFAHATRLVMKWREDAGLHPEARLDEITGAELTGIIVLLVSFVLKHIHFATLASKKHPEISIPQSLTIWTPVEEMQRDIQEFTGFDKAVISKVFDSVTLKASDVSYLEKYTTKFMPLLIDLGNGFVLRPASSITQNPFYSIIFLMENRKPHLRNEISNLREGWLRRSLYAMFAGTRYQTIEGNVKLKSGDTVVTDLDAAVYDNLTGDLAVIQIKWQDFYVNDVRKLRSKAKNLVSELDDWAQKVNCWIKDNGIEKLTQSLRLKTIKEKPTSVFLFGLSRNHANMKGYGFNISTDNLAICNWPQFLRNRYEIGPASNVIKDLFFKLKEQQNHKVESKPLPMTFEIGEAKVSFEDLWRTFDE